MRRRKDYVSPILNCFNGEIVAFEMHDNMKKELCIDTIKQLHEKYDRLEGAVLHSDLAASTQAMRSAGSL